MRAVSVAGWLLLAAGLSSSALAAADKPFTGVFEGTGRACSGNLYIRTKTVEWNTPFSACKRTGYEVLEKDFDGEPKRLALRLKNRSKHCRYGVVEVTQASRYAWNATAYPSLEAFRKRALPEWSNSVLPGRMVLSCPMILLE